MTAKGSGRRFLSPKALPPGDEYVRVVRAEEEQAEQALLDGDLVYVRAPRKSGKSSLAARLSQRLAKDEAGGGPRIVASLSLLSIGTNAAGPAFLNALETRQAEDFLSLAGKACLTPEEAATVRKEAGDRPDWFWGAVAIVARRAAAPVVVFVDEIEQLLGDQRADHRAVGEPWLITLRDLHQQAAGAFTACVLGRLPPRLLVRSPELTPFNTAREIVLPNFSELQIKKDMAGEIGAVFDGLPMAAILARAVYRQTAGQPNQTQCLLRALSDAYRKDPASIGDPSDAIEAFVVTDPECQPSTSNTYMDIDDTFDRPSVWPARDALTVYGDMLKVAADAGGNIDPAVRYDAWSDAHLMLEAVGLAQVETREDGPYLVARNRIARRMFTRKWVTKRRVGLGGEETSPRSQVSRDLLEMETLARQELCRTDWAQEHKASVTPGSGHEVVKGALFEFELVRQSPPERLTLQMFRGVGEFGKRLWLRQVRTLRQLSGRAEAIPNIYRGGTLDDDKVAYIITQRPELTLADPGFNDYVQAHRDWAMSQFISLANGLAKMAEEGVSHRNIWPGAVRMEAPEENSAPPQMKLASFEFSVMLRSVVGGPESPDQQSRHRHASLRAAFLRQPPNSRPFAPPELLAGLFGEGGDPIPTLVTGDVFSLGMLALSWFLPLPSPTAFEVVLRQGAPGDAIYDAEAHFAYLKTLGEELERAIASRRIPASLGRLLEGMIEPHPRARLLPEEVVEALHGVTPWLRAWASGRRKPLLACYSYPEMSAELHRQGAITTPSDTEADKRSVEEILERETANAVLFHAPRGIAPFVSNPNSDQRAAQWVLMGPTWLFYCQRYERRAGGFGGAREQTKHILRIAYAWPRRRAWRAVPSKQVQLSAYGPLELAEQRGSPILDRANDARFREWDAVLAEAQRMAPQASFEIAQTAFSWVVEAQREELELRRFPVERVGGPGAECNYRLDESEYRRWRDRNMMRAQVSQADAVADPAERFEQVLRGALDEGDYTIRLRPFDRPTEGRGSVATLTEVSGAGIALRGRSLPARAWIELEDAWRARRPVYQQEAAIRGLAATPALFDQLLQPHVIVDEELFSEDHLQRAVGGLAGRSPEIVRKIVTSSPLVALQGPPGTGKTTIIAAVIQSLLEMDQTQRILVTSQSNAAVDNIALRLLDLGLTEEDRAICVRVASPEAFKKDGSVDSRVMRLRPELVAERIAVRLRRVCAEKLAAEVDPRLRKAYEKLAEAAHEGGLELIERVRESAAVVFATTAGTKRVVDDGFLPVGTGFDMAIIDEASKAWPMEIVQPMLLASRNLLVGDHRQLPAFGSTDMERLLAQCINSGFEEFRVLANHQQAISAWLKLFATFFAKDNAKYVGADLEETLPGWRDNRAVAEQLDLQFRMRSDIADVISRAFYKNKLESHSSVDLRERPAWVEAFAAEVGASGGILWIDTPPGERFQNNSPSVNEDQAELAARLLARAVELGADPRRDAVILSPYKLQRGAIRTRLIGRHDAALAEAVHTADSFQGQEAELVIVSLTRGPPLRGRDAGKATERYGFLVQEERANVMMSRARELLVILGDFDFFADAVRVEQMNNPGSAMDLGFWGRLCDRIGRTGRVIGYDELPSNLGLR